MCFAAQIKHLPPIVIFVHGINPDFDKNENESTE